MKKIILSLLFCLVYNFLIYAQANDRSEYKNLLYATVGDRLLALDLYMPENVKQPFLIARTAPAHG